MALPHGVVVGQPVVPAAHDVEGGQVPPGELHRAEEVVADVRAEDRVLALAQLGGEAEEDLLHRLGGNLVLGETLRVCCRYPAPIGHPYLSIIITERNCG